MTLPIPHPDLLLSLPDYVRAARREAPEVAEEMALAAAQAYLRRGARAQAATLLSAVAEQLPLYEAITLRDVLAELLEGLADLRGALLQAGIVDGQRGSADTALRVGRIRLALGERSHARRDLERARDWAEMTGEHDVRDTARALLDVLARGAQAMAAPTAPN
jgi:hypothetical protein